MQPTPAVFLEYLFCLPVECHQFFYSLPTILFTSPENFKTLTPCHLTHGIKLGSCQAENAIRGTFQPVTCKHRRFC